jgi:hypothetical protein
MNGTGRTETVHRHRSEGVTPNVTVICTAGDSPFGLADVVVGTEPDRIGRMGATSLRADAVPRSAATLRATPRSI